MIGGNWVEEVGEFYNEGASLIHNIYTIKGCKPI